MVSLDVDEAGDKEVFGWYFRWLLRQSSWNTVSPEDRVRRCAEETKKPRYSQLNRTGAFRIAMTNSITCWTAAESMTISE